MQPEALPLARPERDRLDRIWYQAHRPTNAHFVHLDACWKIAEPQRHSCRARTGTPPAVVDALIDATVDVICARPCGSPT